MKKVTRYELEEALKRLRAQVDSAKTNEERSNIFNEINSNLLKEYHQLKNLGASNEENIYCSLLVEFNLKLVISTALHYSWYIKNASEDEIYTIARLGILKAIKNFDPEFSQASFATYAHIAIDREFIRSFRRLEDKEMAQGRTELPISFDHMAYYTNAEVDDFYEPEDPEGEYPLELALSTENTKQIMRSFTFLTSQEQYCLAKNLGLINDDIKSKADIGIELGVSRERIRTIVKRAANKLYIMLTDNSMLNSKQLKLKNRLLREPRSQLIDPIEKFVYSTPQAQLEC